jgi:hypothetical protein
LLRNNKYLIDYFILKYKLLIDIINYNHSDMHQTKKILYNQCALSINQLKSKKFKQAYLYRDLKIY